MQIFWIFDNIYLIPRCPIKIILIFKFSQIMILWKKKLKMEYLEYHFEFILSRK